MSELTSSPMFGLALTCGVYALSCILKKKWDNPLLNPLVFAIAVICLFLSGTGIPLEDYQQGGGLINAMLTPVTCVLAVMVFRCFAVLKKKWIPILAGCIAGALTAIGCTVALCRLFGLDEQMTMTLLPKSVTGPFAVAISEMIGGIPSVTIACVSLTGIMGLLLTPYLIRLMHMRDPVATGAALGTSCHALGTVRAMEMGEEQGAMSSLAMCISGVVMVVIAVFLQKQ